jgi:hypothetical protein
MCLQPELIQAGGMLVEILHHIQLIILYNSLFVNLARRLPSL